MAGKREKGHYCKICGCHKANEKFTGKGHANHICKECQQLSAAQQSEQQKLNRLERIAMRLYPSKDELNQLERYAKKDSSPEVREFAQDILERFQQYKEAKYTDCALELEEVKLSDCDDEFKADLLEFMEEELTDLILMTGYVPTEKQRHRIMDKICKAIQDDCDTRLIINEDFENHFNNRVELIVRQFREKDISITSYEESLIVVETERLVIRRFTRDDLPSLHTILANPEVMYAWEHGFSKRETRKWLNRQLTRYHKDGYGYFAVLLKETAELIGQVGLMKSVIQGVDVTELGYIFDNRFWKKGYCMESVMACLSYAFQELKLDSLYCSIRPNNIPSIHIATKIGMEQVGEHIVHYNGLELPHNIYYLKNSANLD